MLKNATDIMTIDEVAKILRIQPRTVYRKIAKREIPFFRLGTRGAIRFHKKEISRWIGTDLR